MEKTISAAESGLSDEVLRDIEGGDVFVAERDGRRVAVVVPIKIYDWWKERREAFFDKLEAMAEEANLSEEEAEQLVAEAVDAVRASSRV